MTLSLDQLLSMSEDDMGRMSQSMLCDLSSLESVSMMRDSGDDRAVEFVESMTRKAATSSSFSIGPRSARAIMSLHRKYVELPSAHAEEIEETVKSTSLPRGTVAALVVARHRR